MKNVTKTYVSQALIGVVFFGLNAAVQAAGTSSAQFLKLGAGARAAGMGDAYSSVADDANATYWNPAGLAQVQNKELSFMHNSYLQDTQYQYASGVIPFRTSGLGMFIQRLDLGTIDRYSAADTKDGSFTAGSMAAGVGVGMKVREDLMVGFNVKYIQESIENESATSFAGDIGALYRRNGTTLGASVQHLGPGMKMVKDSYALPLTIRAGASRRFFEDRLLTAVEVSKPNDNSASFHIGAEYELNKIISVRGGYRTTPGNSLDVDGLTDITGGMGVTLNQFSLDYAISPFGDLGMAHRISLRVRFSQN